MNSALLRHWLRNLWERPRGIARYGRGISFPRPRRVEGAGRIEIGDRVSIRRHAHLAVLIGRDVGPSPSRLVIGAETYIGSHAHIVCAQGVFLGERCVLSDHVYINDVAHDVDVLAGPILSQRLVSKGPIHIGPDTFIGYRSIIFSGVSLGHHCVVGANSLVTRSFPPMSMVGGSPARLLKVYSLADRKWVPAGDPS